jgi:hypothetical protein
MRPSLGGDPVVDIHSSVHPDLTDQLTASSNRRLILVKMTCACRRTVLCTVPIITHLWFFDLLYDLL